MARLDIRLSGLDKERLLKAANAEGKTLSAFIRARLLDVSEGPSVDVGDAVEDHERRLSRLEEMAGL